MLANRRNRRIAAVTLWTLSAGAASGFAAIRKAAQPIDGQYIVVMKNGALQSTESDAFGNRPTLPEVASQMAEQHRGEAGRSFGSALEGFVFHGDRTSANELAADPRVAYVSEDGWVRVAGQQAPTPSWGLDRIDQQPVQLDSTYNYDAEGQGVDVYVIDTGIRSTHVDFGGRVELGRSFTAIVDGNGTEDCNGHGTHVAGIIGSSTYGVAKSVTLHPVRVFDCGGYGQISDIVAGVDWITSLYASTTTTTSGGKGGKGGKTASQTASLASVAGAVVNMSFETSKVSALDDAINNSMAKGISYVAAAGNDGADACQYSPSHIPGVITVGAADAADRVAAYSNTGGCVDLFAPGSSVTSTYNRSDSDALTMSGTSMAAPHVTGTVALLLSINPTKSPLDVATLVKAAATPNSLANIAVGSPNLLLYAPFTGYTTDMAPVAKFTAACRTGSCTFDASGSADDRSILAYSWDFGNGKTGSGKSISVSYGRRAPSQVTVTLTLTDSGGQTTSLQQIVRPNG